MEELLKHLLAQDGTIIGYIILGAGAIGSGVYWLVKNTPKFVINIFKKYLSDEKIKHNRAAKYRKCIIPKIKKELLYLAEETGVDRALLLEYSNGSSNLVGLPFMYLTATAEVLRNNISSVLGIYQKVNVSMFAEFLEELEDKSYFYFKDIEEIKDTYHSVYTYMKPNGVKSGLFYSLYDKDNSVGFIAVTSTTHTFERQEVLPTVAEVAQVISSLINYDKIKEEIE